MISFYSDPKFAIKELGVSELFNYGNVINIHHLQLSHYLLHQVQVDHFHQ